MYFLIDIKNFFGIENHIINMLNKKNIFKHSALNPNFPQIGPAKKFVPDWYRNGKRVQPSDEVNTDKLVRSFPVKFGFKMCVPFSESLVSGYIVPLPFPIAVEQTEGGPRITWNPQEIQLIGTREFSDNPTLPTPAGMAPIHFIWQTQHMFKIPEGYSALFTHPLNRYDLPFLTLSSIVDGEFVMQNGNVPVYFNTTFEGIIPEGTPIAQIILFKRENWISKYDESILREGDNNSFNSHRLGLNWYRNKHWKKKSYD